MRKFYVLSNEECEFFEALCETVVPEGENPEIEPGANTVGAIGYIDSFLFGMPDSAKQYFRGAIEALNLECIRKFQKRFQELSLHHRNEALRAFFLDPLTRERMFDLRSLALEGFYSDYHDPNYEGITAWNYLEFGGKRISDLKKDWSFLQIWKDKTQKDSVAKITQSDNSTVE